MSRRRQYPRIGSRRSTDLGLCVMCPAAASEIVDVQVSWFRGDDVTVKVCPLHRREPAEVLLEAKLERARLARVAQMAGRGLEEGP